MFKGSYGFSLTFPRISVYTGSKQIEPSFEACARPKSASWKTKQHFKAFSIVLGCTLFLVHIFNEKKGGIMNALYQKTKFFWVIWYENVPSPWKEVWLKRRELRDTKVKNTPRIKFEQILLTIEDLNLQKLPCASRVPYLSHEVLIQ
jgi:hypothetical protein